MRTLQLLTLSVLLCGAASSSIAPGGALAQTRPAGKGAHMNQDMEKVLVAFADAWNKHDVDALMSFMTPDGVFEASAGNTIDGERYEGQQAVRAAYAAIFQNYPDARWNNARHFVAGDRGVSEWTFTGTMKDGKRVEVTGCDLFTFRDGKIALKNSYRKNRPPLG
jgi:taurine dehydrogenase small subunit